MLSWELAPARTGLRDRWSGLVLRELRRRAHFYYRLTPWYEAHYGLFTNQPAHTERGLRWIEDRL